MADLTEVRAWAGIVSAEQASLTAGVAAEQAKPLPVGDNERALRAGLIGHWRYRINVLRALGRFLADADVALSAAQPHPVQKLVAPASSSGRVSIPPKPPRNISA